MVLVFQSLEIMKSRGRPSLPSGQTNLLTEIKGSSATTTKYDNTSQCCRFTPLIFKMIFTLMIFTLMSLSEIKQQISDQMKKNDSNKIYWSEKEDAPSDVQPFKN